MTKVTEVTIQPIRPKDGLVAIANIIIDEVFVVGSIGIYTKMSGGFRITYPTKKVGKSSVYIFKPITQEVGQIIEEAIINEYENLITQGL